jgi:hypothetical protein
VTDQESVFQGLKAELLELFRRGVHEPFPEEPFNDLAMRTFRFQLDANPVYGAFLSRRLGGDASSVERWEEIPPLPTRAFKAAPLVSGNPDSVEAIFRTSGTTQGHEGRGVHRIRSLEIYRGSLAPNFRAHLLPEGGNLPVLSLLPSPQESPDSSLSFMIGEMAGEEGGYFSHPVEGIRVKEFHRALKAAEDKGGPVLLAGTAFSYANWLEVSRKEGWTFRLPEGTRIMETGGYKGRAKSLPKDTLYEEISAHFDVPIGRIVNEYGMTELLSQFYEPVLVAGKVGSELLPSKRFHRSPPWVRTRVLHPLSLEAVEPGEVGILAHLDLANLGSVAAILTDDLGYLVPGGFTLQGRSPGAEPRGCSLAMEEFLIGLKGGGDGL